MVLKPTAQYADNIKYLNLISAEDSVQRSRRSLTRRSSMGANATGLAVDDPASLSVSRLVSVRIVYRTRVGNDSRVMPIGYKLHLVYG